MTTASVHRPVRGVRRAFTLIELLVSMTVLTVLILAVSQIVSGTTSLSTANRQHLDADGQARLVFDRMALDFDRMLKRRDVDYVFKDTTVPQTGGDDKFFFYTEAPAFFYALPGSSPPPASIQSPLSLVGYRVNTKDQKYPYQLSRLGKGLDWDESNASAQSTNGEPVSIAFLTPLSTPSASPTPTPDASTTLPGRWPSTVGTASNDYTSDDTDLSVAGSYHVIADQVCRMEICFLLKPRPATSTAAAQPAYYSLKPYYDEPGTANSLHTSVSGMQDVQAIVVALAVLDRSSRQIATDLSKIKTVLDDIKAEDLTATVPTLMAKKWQDAIDGGKLVSDAGLPRPAASQMRVYQRYFYLDTH